METNVESANGRVMMPEEKAEDCFAPWNQRGSCKLFQQVAKQCKHRGKVEKSVLT
jgi:hypothetical protein